LNDDIAVPAALAEIHGNVREGNAALAADEVLVAEGIASRVRAMMGILGIDPLDDQWQETQNNQLAAMQALDTLIQTTLLRRQAARKEKNWALADQARDELTRAGITVTDSPEGSRWSLT
jgi:cysteinyl-tRNA synthetase